MSGKGAGAGDFAIGFVFLVLIVIAVAILLIHSWKLHRSTGAAKWFWRMTILIMVVPLLLLFVL